MISYSTKEIITDLFNFSKKPDDFQFEINNSKKLKVFSLIFIFDIIVCTLLTFLINGLDEILNLNLETNLVNEYIKSNSIIFAFLLIAVISPIVEELIFRFFLRYDKVFPDFIIKNIARHKQIPLQESISIFRVQWNRFFPIIFFVSLAIFSILHIVNYKLSVTILLLLPLLILPQFIAGFFFAYIRIRLNFSLTVILHSLHNIFFAGLLLVPMIMSGYYSKFHYGEKTDFESNHFKIIVEEIVYSPKDDNRINISERFSKFEANNASIKEINETITHYLAVDTTYQYKEQDIIINEKYINNPYIKFNIKYLSKNELNSNLDTLVKYLNKILFDIKK